MLHSPSAGLVWPSACAADCTPGPTRPVQQNCEPTRRGANMTGGDDPGDGRPALPFFTFTDFPPPSTTVQVEFGACSKRGRKQQVNSDHFLIIRMGRSQETVMTSLPPNVVPNRFDEYGYAMIVADGLGDAAS